MDSRKKVLFQMVLFLLLCWVFSGTAAAQHRIEGVASVETRTEPSTPTRGSSFDKYDNLQIVASIDNLGNNRYEIVELTLEQDTILRLYAIGEGARAGMRDFGGIENAQTGQLVWVMHHLSTVHAGGAEKNRMVDRLLPLAAGTYRLHFKTDHAHAYNSRNEAMPDYNWCGIRLYDETALHTECLSDFWGNASAPEEMGWLSEGLQALIPDMNRLGTDALMIVTDGKIVYEWGNTTNIIRSHSVRKSFLSALYGIYVAEKRIDTSKTLEQLGITERVPLTKAEQQATVLDLLKARSGVYITAAAEVASMRKRRPKRGSHEPGTFWYYNNWDFNVLGTIFRQETGEDIYEAFKRRIADPTGMQDFILERQGYRHENKRSQHPAYPFLISARDLAKFGQLFLKKSPWNTERIIPANWQEVSTRSYSMTTTPGVGYGFMWWILVDDAFGMPKGSFYASGYGGQILFMLPHINSLIVHRINIDVPGTDIFTSDIAPFVLIKKIMKAHRGNDVETPPSEPREKRRVAQKRLLDAYGRTAQNYGRSFVGFKKGLGVCALILISGTIVWPLLFVIRRRLGQEILAADRSMGINRASSWAKWITAGGGLICAAYIYVCLKIPDPAFEWVVNIGMPPDLKVHEKLLFEIPKFAALLSILLMVFTIEVWKKKYWTLPERIHFSVITVASMVFVILSYHLNLIVQTG
jgi:CubicO group peptidase (beta-lactamase class C family)